MAKQPVILNVYDMYWTNEYTTRMGIGVFHSGIEVYNTEYAYGGHPLPLSGVFQITPKDAEDLGPNFKFKESIVVGTTDFMRNEVQQLADTLGRQYIGDKYHLLNFNCNHFSSAFAEVLCGKPIPNWVNRLAYVSTCIPFLQRALPKEWLTPLALEETLPEHSCQDPSLNPPSTGTLNYPNKEFQTVPSSNSKSVFSPTSPSRSSSINSKQPPQIRESFQSDLPPTKLERVLDSPGVNAAAASSSSRMTVDASKRESDNVRAIYKSSANAALLAASFNEPVKKLDLKRNSRSDKDFINIPSLRIGNANSGAKYSSANRYENSYVSSSAKAPTFRQNSLGDFVNIDFDNGPKTEN